MTRSSSLQPQEGNIDGREYLRSTWQFAAIAQFLRTFQSALDLNDFETEDLEDALLSPQPVHFLVNILMRLLRAMTGLRFISPDNWQQYWTRTFNDQLWQQYSLLTVEIPGRDGKQEEPTEPAFVNGDDFWQLTLTDKVRGIHALCEMALMEAEKFLPSVRDEEEQHLWRVDPVGYDAQNNTFWLFDDNRLYMETPLPEDRPKPPKPKAKTGGRKPPARRGGQKEESIEAAAATEEETGQKWSLVCRTLEEWRYFPQRFEKSTNAAEKGFYRFLVSDLQPQVVQVLEEKERERELQQALTNRKRSDRLVVREIERMELEEQERRRKAESDRQAQSRREALGSRRAEQEHKRAEREREERLKEREDRIRKREELKHKKDLLEAKMESRRLAKEQQKQQSGRQHHWNFDCPCGLYGQDVDDGRPMMECEQCNTWVHIPCINRRFAKNNVPIPDWDTIPYMCEYCASGQERPPPSERRAPKEPSAKRVKRSAEASDNQEQNGKLPKIKLVISPRATEMPSDSSIPDIPKLSQKNSPTADLPGNNAEFRPHFINGPPSFIRRPSGNDGPLSPSSSVPLPSSQQYFVGQPQHFMIPSFAQQIQPQRSYGNQQQMPVNFHPQQLQQMQPQFHQQMLLQQQQRLQATQNNGDACPVNGGYANANLYNNIPSGQSFPQVDLLRPSPFYQQLQQLPHNQLPALKSLIPTNAQQSSVVGTGPISPSIVSHSVVLSPVLPGNNSNNDNNSMLKSPANTASTTTFQLPVPSRTNNQF